MGLLRDSIERGGDEVPEGWKTAPQWAEEEGLSPNHAQKLIRGLVNSGKWEMEKFRLFRDERAYPVPHYRPKGDKEK